MERKVIILLAIILFIFIILNHVSLFPNSSSSEQQNIEKQFGYIQTPQNCSNVPGCCSLTQFGCCPDGVNSRINSTGTNCPVTYSQGYNTTSYPPTSYPPTSSNQITIIKPLP